MRSWKQVYRHKPTWELANIEAALSSPIGMFLNNQEDFERLMAVRHVLRKKRGLNDYKNSSSCL